MLLTLSIPTSPAFAANKISMTGMTLSCTPSAIEDKVLGVADSRAQAQVGSHARTVVPAPAAPSALWQQLRGEDREAAVDWLWSISSELAHAKGNQQFGMKATCCCHVHGVYVEHVCQNAMTDAYCQTCFADTCSDGRNLHRVTQEEHCCA